MNWQACFAFLSISTPSHAIRTAIEKLNDTVSKVYAFRAEQQALLHPGGIQPL